MDIETPSDRFKNISYKNSAFGELVSHLTKEIDSPGHHLCLFLGVYTPNKQEALDKMSSELKREIRIVDTDDLVTRIESETFANIENFFEGLDESNVILYFKNANKLCGVYTGNSHSRVKYATPEERLFLKKVQDFNGLVIVDIEEYIDADKTLRRAAQSIVSFPLPDSKIKRFFWHLRNYTLHGCELKTKRPEAYLDATG